MAKSETTPPLPAPDLVTVVFGHLPAAQLCALLKHSNVWMLDSGENEAEYADACRAKKLLGMPGIISSSSLRPGGDTADWLRDVLELVDDHFNPYAWTEWKRIDVVGLQLTPALKAEAEAWGAVSERENGFSITAVENA